MLISFRRFLCSFSKPRGFTLIELLVVTAIIVLITAFIMFRQGRFNSSSNLRTLTYSVALSNRQAQVYGESVRGQGVSTPTFAPAYGVRFSTEKNIYTLFADANGDGQYQDTGGEKVKEFRVGNPNGTDYVVNTACSIAGASMQCTNACPAVNPAGVTGCTPQSITWMTVIFRRPNPDACIATNVNSAVCAQGAAGGSYTGAYIQLQAVADGGNSHGVEVSTTGQIEVLDSGS